MRHDLFLPFSVNQNQLSIRHYISCAFKNKSTTTTIAISTATTSTTTANDDDNKAQCQTMTDIGLCLLEHWDYEFEYRSGHECWSDISLLCIEASCSLVVHLMLCFSHPSAHNTFSDVLELRDFIHSFTVSL
jgi:hypothetical protein